MKIVVMIELEVPVEVPDSDFDIEAWLHGEALCLSSLLPPNEYFRCVCNLRSALSWRLPTVEDEYLFDGNQEWAGGPKPKEGVDC